MFFLDGGTICNVCGAALALDHVSWYQPPGVNLNSASLECFSNNMSRDTPFNMFSNFVLRGKSQGSIILSACFELLFTQICRCPPALSENPCLISLVPKSKSQKQLPSVFVYQSVPKQRLTMFSNGTCWKTGIHGLSSMPLQPNVFPCSEHNVL